MESTSAYIISASVSLVFLLIAALIANAIKFEGGSNPRDPQKRRTWFWVVAGLTPAVNYLLGYFVFKPHANIMVVNKYMSALAIGTALSLVLYIVLGFVVSKIFKTGKVGNWF